MPQFTESLPDNVTVPPPEVRTMIEKTAGYVARNGGSFEQRIRTKESTNSKFFFLQETDPYHGYYKHVLSQIQGNGGIIGKLNTSSTKVLDAVEEINESIYELQPPRKFKCLEIEGYEINNPESKISILDLNIIKIVAQFTAVNGKDMLKSFQEYVANHSKLSVQFAFLNPSHSMHQIFQKYISIYDVLLNDKAEIINFLESYDQFEFLDSCFNRAEYMKKEKIDKNKEEEKSQRERFEFASIDWQDFVVVETIDFSEIDDVAELNAPLIKSDLEYRSLFQKQANSLLEEAPPDFEEGNYDEGDEMPVYVNDEDIKDKLHEEDKDSQDVKIKRKPVPKGMKIKSAGETRILKRHYGQHLENNDSMIDPQTGEKLLQCPLTGKLIPENKFQQHISILLRDPKYKEEKARYDSKFRYGSNLSTDQIYQNIKSLVKENNHNNDDYGDDDEERDNNETNGGSYSKKRKVISNGLASTAAEAKKLALNSINQEEEKEKKRQLKNKQFGPKLR